ncbi:protein adenylyltransferase SelO [Pseudonocardia oroxyli]|uniref:Protein nucleotidyltransferase YdiU n=1 Tax=Pseudonocardia oroxyli TaxID=366584 RepID=A0A1G8C657_PSEOR|nr:YdiU family protein [Pseudonocardia oroxyli]SDH40828.1 Uncharacterized conserved protein YdiU, UPF0061 family [Pseudonocardia oroxyli]
MAVGERTRWAHTYADAVPALSVPWPAVAFPQPRLLVWNDDLRIDPLDLTTLVGAGADTRALVYSGHQWGVYKPRLGDGRALLLGELPDGRDLHLKGTGPTPFSRGLDGRAAVGPMLREYLFGEAMHALGIPTTRALAVVATGERIERDGRELPGAVLTRVAASHLRVGTFQYAAATEPGSLRALADHAIARHFPDAAGSPRPYRELFRRVVDAQAALVARWMLVGFVHGVMSTDNTTISGETIDYGPCAFMDAVDPATVFSSLDTTGRYAYAAQPEILRWNLARLAESLRPLDEVEDLLDEVPRAYARYWAQGMAAKLGVSTPDAALATDLMALLHAQHVDFTTFFRALAAGTARDLFPDRAAFDAWAARRAPLVTADRAAMDRVNPLYVPRNHITDAVLAAAEQGDLAPLHRLLAAVREPYVERPGLADLTRPGTGPHVTYCGT